FTVQTVIRNQGGQTRPYGFGTRSVSIVPGRAIQLFDLGTINFPGDSPGTYTLDATISPTVTGQTSFSVETRRLLRLLKDVTPTQVPPRDGEVVDVTITIDRPAP